MVNALTPFAVHAGTEELMLHQALHGYSEGHRLIESSIPIPDDLKRLMQRMSDLSGTSVVSGFQDYLTGYPLQSLGAYALAKTWYAAEMSRPGCVWTHTLIIPETVMAKIASLAALRTLFRRPNAQSSEVYSKPIVLEHKSASGFEESFTDQQMKLQAFMAAHYEKESRPLIVGSAHSHEYIGLIFAAWSQKWPALRMSFTFCTGSLSARTFEKRPLDVQCVPIAATRQVSREIGDAGLSELTLLDSIPPNVPRWAVLATDDALQKEGGPLRRFLWSVADEKSSRADFESFVSIYDSLERQLPFLVTIDLTASHFPRPSDGQRLKLAVLGDRKRLLVPHAAPKDILFALATTEHHESFNVGELELKERACHLLAEQPTEGCLLVGELLQASLNPIGEEVLKSLILAMSSEDALVFAVGQQQFLPTFVRVNPRLATSAQLWRLAGDHRRELFESIAGQPTIEPEVVCGIVDAMLDSDSDGFIRRAFTQWGRVAIFEVLDWSEAHGGSLTPNCRSALSFHVLDVTSWIATEGEKSTNILAALAYVVAPYASRVAQAQDDTKIWLHTLHALCENHRKDDADYVAAFLFALALCNAPPAPLDLLSESFERVHRLAEKQQLRDDAWSILEPFVPELSWGKNWDRCERMKRALMAAFTRYTWPPRQLRERIRDQDLVEQLLKSARKVGAGHYFQNV
jgi:hypothetical protein